MDNRTSKAVVLLYTMVMKIEPLYLKRKMNIKHCQFCGEEVERYNNIKKVTCFDCKMKRMDERLKERNKSLKNENRGV